MLRRRLLEFRYGPLARIWPAPVTPFDHLRDWPRHRATTVTLFGAPYEVPDGAMFFGQYREIVQAETYRFVSRRPDPVVVDCGANCGLSVLYVKRLYPAARITAVEADPGVFEYLRKNCAAHGLANVTLLQRAVSGSAGPVTFYSEGSDSGRMHGTLPSQTPVRVEGILLDDLIPGPVDFLKVDIEGAETDALLACTKLGLVDRLFVEYHSFRNAPQTLHRLLARLEEAGFRYYVRHVFAPSHALCDVKDYLGMDLQLNISAVRPTAMAASS